MDSILELIIIGLIKTDYPLGSPRAPWGNLSELEIVKFKQLDGAGAPSSCLNLTISSERPLGSPGVPWGALGGN